MAKQLKERTETRSERLVVLFSPREKRAVEQGAREAGMSLSDFVRTATQNYVEPTAEEKAEFQKLIAEMQAANARSDETLARLEATNARAEAYDHEAYKARLEKAWTKADGSTDWEVVRSVFNGAGFGA